MKVVVVGFKKNYLEKEIRNHESLEIDSNNPDVVLSFGGDGTLLYSENLYPGIPKVFVRHPSNCNSCKNHDYKKVIDALVNNKFKVSEFIKIKASINGEKLIALNDINIHYKLPCALRFSVEINKKKIAEKVIGDGLIVATPYGSSGYFRSITRKTFKNGIGIAFNNPMEKMKKLIVPEHSSIKIKILRGPGAICSDCNKKIIQLKSGDVINIQKHSGFARILTLKGKKKVRI